MLRSSLALRSTPYLDRLRPRLPSRWSSTLSQPEKDRITSWITNQKIPADQPTLTDHISFAQIRALGCTLPTLDGRSQLPPHRNVGLTQGSTLSPGHSLIFCNPTAPEHELESDATTRTLSPPEPFVRRMWAGGRFEFKRPLCIGEDIKAEAAVTSIEIKRLELENPMVIVEQRITTKPINTSVANLPNRSEEDACIIETRSYVYVPLTNERRIRRVKDLPDSHFSFSYTPTDTTLFRFSALTFNAHRIHLDRGYSQRVENLPERLVHGPMTALMLLEVLENNRPQDLQISTFEYKATNPLFIDRRITIHGNWLNKHDAELWAQTDDGVVGMTGKASLKPFS
ncbi:hypothetical protein BU17DRAFT_78676 [Hysterangium stoloniferum]|nr:hypothetical protein BU17DRAFT_78676 [Hysterangium stoloniferum]